MIRIIRFQCLVVLLILRGCLVDAVNCADGLVYEDICCAKSCGTCGGHGCSARPGGASSCCGKDIEKSGRDCAKVAAPCVLGPGPDTPISTWPAPRAATFGHPLQMVFLDPTVFHTHCSAPAPARQRHQDLSSSACKSIVGPALARATANAFYYHRAVDTSEATLVGLSVQLLTAAPIPLQFGVDESYTLSINATHASIEAETEWGALHAIETFASLVGVENPGTSTARYYLRTEVPVRIADSPRVRWRGLLIDTARHYLSVGTIHKAIDAMAATKLNDLHWHITDDESFPLCLESFPQLCDAGAYVDARGNARNYTTTEVRDLVAYANARGVRVTPELDLPGHSTIFSRGLPNLYIPCAKVSTNQTRLAAASPSVSTTGPTPLPDVTSEDFFSFLETVMAEFAGLFPDGYIHNGGDEVNTQCWAQSAKIQSWMKTKGYTDVKQVLDYFQMRVQGIVAKHHKTPLFWDEFFTDNLTIVEGAGTSASIRGKASVLQSTLARGIPALTTGWQEAWYLDHSSSSRYVQQKWQAYWQHDPFAGLSAAELGLTLGGEVDMWGEGVDDTNFIARVFPVASAAAERMWSPVYPSSSAPHHDVARRLALHRCLLNLRGVGAAPIGSGAPCT